MLFVIAHEPSPEDRSPAARRLRVAADAARQSGLVVIRLPFPFAECAAILPKELPGELAVYSGPIPQAPEHYRALERTLGAGGATLVNGAAASEQATRIEHWHQRLGELSARTVILRDPADLSVAADLGFPVFVKGLVKSAKEQGLEACLARDREALAVRARGAWRQGQTLVARELLPLRTTGEVLMGFPQAREYRVTLLDGDVLGSQFYWGPADPLGTLTESERQELLGLARAGASRLEARLLAIDVGQLEDGSWRIIEVGDAQHTGLAHIPPHRYWTALYDRLG